MHSSCDSIWWVFTNFRITPSDTVFVKYNFKEFVKNLRLKNTIYLNVKELFQNIKKKHERKSLCLYLYFSCNSVCRFI